MSEPSTAVATQAPAAPQSQFLQREQTGDEIAFGLMQRRAQAFAMSPLVPDHLRNGGKETAVANCLICLELAKLMNESPLIVMQNIHFVKGKPGWNATYMISRANASGFFKGGIKFKTVGTGEKMGVTAYATLSETGETVEKTVDMAMAKAVGWASNEKYKQIPEQMLSYRAATFLIRLYCPQVMLGYRTSDEIEDSAVGNLPVKQSLSIRDVTNASEVHEDAEVISASATTPIGGQLFGIDEEQDRLFRQEEQAKQHANTK